MPTGIRWKRWRKPWRKRKFESGEQGQGCPTPPNNRNLSDGNFLPLAFHLRFVREGWAHVAVQPGGLAPRAAPAELAREARPACAYHERGRNQAEGNLSRVPAASRTEIVVF